MWTIHLKITNINVTAVTKWKNANIRRTGPIFKICCETGYSLKNKDKEETHTHPFGTQIFHSHFLTPENDAGTITYTKHFDAVTLPDQPNLLPQSFSAQKAL